MIIASVKFVVGLVFGLVLLHPSPVAAQMNDDCATPTVIGGLPFTFTLETTLATTAGGDPGGVLRQRREMSPERPSTTPSAWTAAAKNMLGGYQAGESWGFRN